MLLVQGPLHQWKTDPSRAQFHHTPSHLLLSLMSGGGGAASVGGDYTASASSMPAKILPTEEEFFAVNLWLVYEHFALMIKKRIVKHCFLALRPSCWSTSQNQTQGCDWAKGGTRIKIQGQARVRTEIRVHGQLVPQLKSRCKPEVEARWSQSDSPGRVRKQRQGWSGSVTGLECGQNMARTRLEQSSGRQGQEQEQEQKQGRESQESDTVRGTRRVLGRAVLLHRLICNYVRIGKIPEHGGHLTLG